MPVIEYFVGHIFFHIIDLALDHNDGLRQNGGSGVKFPSKLVDRSSGCLNGNATSSTARQY